MEELKVGEYYRTKNGLIGKIKTIKSGKRQFTRTTELLINGRHRVDDILKHSSNIKKIIMEGDLIYYKLGNSNKLQKDFVIRNHLDELQVYFYSMEQIEIKTIITKEKLKFEEYEVK